MNEKINEEMNMLHDERGDYESVTKRFFTTITFTKLAQKINKPRTRE